jgi:dipeptidyl aminopeptidase/acylaminoacyl peptidase
MVEMLGATNGRPEFEDLTMGNADFSSAVQGVIAWYPVSDIGGLTDTGTPPADAIMGYDVRADRDRNHDANPIDLVTKDFPPLLLVHGSEDAIVPYQQSLDMQKKVKEQTGIEPRLITFMGAAHGDARIKSTENVIYNLRFVDKILYDGKNPHRNTNFMIIKIAD